jgi:hypothetical protein
LVLFSSATRLTMSRSCSGRIFMGVPFLFEPSRPRGMPFWERSGLRFGFLNWRAN